MKANGSHIIAGFAVLAALVAAGCGTRSLEEAGHRRVPEQAVAERSDDAPEPRTGRLGSGLSPLAPDPREYRTADGRPAPYGRDPVTGRALADQPQTGVPPAATRRPSPAGGNGQVVVVQKGDTLSALARRHNVSVTELKRANALSTDVIREGQRLTVPRA
ncbi:MAG TPA: LysM peptidoglycan-binding domain-containing protein [Hyphomicrobiaceae bacterium]|nr:LysM peptidoglycan-binding domain-containing protein [Hyphomicrobiaceae bacterium]